jgi:hypothetical protein
MILVECPYGSDKFYDVLNPDCILSDRITITSKRNSHYIALSDRLSKWLNDYKIEYNLIHRDNLYISFKNKKDAMLFKLTWC